MKLPVLVFALAAPATGLMTHISSPMNDYNLSFDQSERLMVFARSEADFRNAKIYTAEYSNGDWTAPRLINFSDERFSDSDPWLTPDGQTLYFISDRPAVGREQGRTDYDLWISYKTGGSWSAPMHLGANVNSSGQELGPELHSGVLYFSSARRGGPGGLDIFSARQNRGGFEPASLLEGPINSSSSESDFTISDDGRAAMFWRSTEDRGTLHISYRTVRGWSPGTPLPSRINLGPFNFTPSFSRDGSKVRFASTVARGGQPIGLADIYEMQLPES